MNSDENDSIFQKHFQKEIDFLQREFPNEHLESIEVDSELLISKLLQFLQYTPKQVCKQILQKNKDLIP